MSASDVIAELLRAHAPLTAIVPAERIAAQADDLPAVLISTVSSVDRHPLAFGGRKHSTSRVRATVAAKSFEQQGTLIGLVRNAGADRHGSFADMVDVVVETDLTGPDIRDDGIFYQSQDFQVSGKPAA